MPETTFQQALALHQAGELEQAEQLYRELLIKDAKNANLLHLLGILLGQQERYEEARPYLMTALALQPDSPTFNNSMGNIEKRLGHIEQAIHYYEKALQSPHASAAVYNNLGALYAQKKDWDKATTHYQKAIALRPDYADAYYNLSMVMTEQRDFTAAIQLLETTLQHQPEHAQAHTHLGQLLLRTERSAEAIQHYQERLKIEPSHTETYHQLAVALTQQNRWEEAIVNYQKTLQLDPSHIEALHNIGALHIMQQQHNLALPYFLRLLEAHPDLDTYYNLGVIYSQQNRHDEAIYYLDEALKLQPDAFNVLVNLGGVYLKKEQPKKATEYYQAALAIKPADKELKYILAALTQQSTPTNTPKAYIEHLFDQYAPHFDQHLTTLLNYRVPELLKAIIQNDPTTPTDVETTLDLGCGTGLCGAVFRNYTNQLIGIDLSEKMLAVARSKNIYDRLENLDIHDALERYISMDLIIAGDVFGYVGDLNRTFQLTAAALKEGGLFTFTTEKTFAGDFKLQENARFAHNKHYIERLAQNHGFTILHQENAILRTQKEQNVEGNVWLLKKSGKLSPQFMENSRWQAPY